MGQDNEQQVEDVEVEDTAEDTAEDVTDAADQGEQRDDTDQRKEGKTTDDKVSRAALDKAIRERQAAKDKARALEARLTELERANEGAEARTARETREKVLAELEGKYKPLIVEKAATADLIAAGVKPGGVKRMIRLMNLGEIDVTDGGDVMGLDEQIDSLKADYPELFGQPEAERKPERRGSRAADGADKRPEPKKTLSVSERQAAALMGKPA